MDSLFLMEGEGKEQTQARKRRKRRRGRRKKRNMRSLLPPSFSSTIDSHRTSYRLFPDAELPPIGRPRTSAQHLTTTLESKSKKRFFSGSYSSAKRATSIHQTPTVQLEEAGISITNIYWATALPIGANPILPTGHGIITVMKLKVGAVGVEKDQVAVFGEVEGGILADEAVAVRGPKGRGVVSIIGEFALNGRVDYEDGEHEAVARGDAEEAAGEAGSAAASAIKEEEAYFGPADEGMAEEKLIEDEEEEEEHRVHGDGGGCERRWKAPAENRQHWPQPYA
ncbi:hypothetical protein M5K25_003431 [Dendrobium thyrsiflorum]|uniref:Uncharacterized protein n=1 Tax=Dendrobium thyrsiflorum TaxID=117978 RepID=A0ABD0VR19_DENTH